MLILKYPQTPTSTQHIYAQKGWRKYMTVKAKAFKEDFLASIKKQLPNKFKPFSKSLEVQYFLTFADKRRRDIDNYCKIVFDSLNGVVWVDDSQIQKLVTVKKYVKGKKGIVLKIKELK